MDRRSIENRLSHVHNGVVISPSSAPLVSSPFILFRQNRPARTALWVLDRWEDSDCSGRSADSDCWDRSEGWDCSVHSEASGFGSFGFGFSGAGPWRSFGPLGFGPLGLFGGLLGLLGSFGVGLPGCCAPCMRTALSSAAPIRGVTTAKAANCNQCLPTEPILRRLIIVSPQFRLEEKCRAFQSGVVCKFVRLKAVRGFYSERIPASVQYGT